MSSKIPIGTIVAFAGGMDTAWLQSQGWLYCDGAALAKSQYADLYFAIGNNFGGGRDTFNLPDLRGRFQRGVDLQALWDPNAGSRQASNPGGLAGDNPGSVQPYLTARPVKPFIATDAGTHKHDVPNAPITNNAYAIAGSKYGIWNNDTVHTSEAGSHTHTVVAGGDAETRPINAYVFFIIKYANT